jgi:hypothetical protein
MLPANFPGKDDVVSDIFEALLDGSLRREDVGARVSHYVAAYNRMFPTNFAKFGDSKMVSLDEVGCSKVQRQPGATRLARGFGTSSHRAND